MCIYKSNIQYVRSCGKMKSLYFSSPLLHLRLTSLSLSSSSSHSSSSSSLPFYGRFYVSRPKGRRVPPFLLSQRKAPPLDNEIPQHLLLLPPQGSFHPPPHFIQYCSSGTGLNEGCSLFTLCFLKVNFLARFCWKNMCFSSFPPLGKPIPVCLRSPFLPSFDLSPRQEWRVERGRGGGDTHVQWGVGGCRGDAVRHTFSSVSPPP